MKNRNISKYEILLLLLFCVLFCSLRMIYLDSSYLMLDDILTIGPLDIQHEKDVSDILATTWQMIHHITNPPLQTLFMRILLHIFGPNLVILRLPNLLLACISAFLLYVCMAKLFTHKVSCYVPLLLLTLSVPSIIYTQQIQPTIHYFFSTMIQVYVFLRIVRYRRSETLSLFVIFKNVFELTFTSLCVFFLNYMSVLIYAILMSYYGYWVILHRKDIEKSSCGLSKRAVYLTGFMLTGAVYGIAVLWRIQSGGMKRGYFEGLYYLDRLSDVFMLVYDFISYHFNFAYTPKLYTPLGTNVLSIPYMIIFVIGIVFFILKSKHHLLLFMCASMAVLMAVSFKLMPFGGIRHSFMLAPFVFIFVGYGIESLYEFRYRVHSSVFVHIVIFSLMIISVATFFFSGKNLYLQRKSSIDLSQLSTLAAQHHLETIVGWLDTYAILEIMDHTQKSILTRQNLTLLPFTPEREPPYLLVSYRYTFNPHSSWPHKNWKGWNYKISRVHFVNKRIIPLIENAGDLDIRTMGVQSIYYPLNGFFVYLIEK